MMLPWSSTLGGVTTLAIHQLDVKNTFLNGDLTKEVYMKQTSWIRAPTLADHVCRLWKPLYGHKEAPRAWYHQFDVFITSLGFVSSKSDTSFHLSLWSRHYLPSALFRQHYSYGLLTSVDDPCHFPFIYGICHDWSRPPLILPWCGCLLWYIWVIPFPNRIRLLHIQIWPLATPAPRPHTRIINCHPLVLMFQILRLTAVLLALCNIWLLLIVIFIQYAIQHVCLYMHDSCEPYMNALKRIIRYLQGTITHGLRLRPLSTDRLVSYTNAYWPGVLKPVAPHLDYVSF